MTELSFEDAIKDPRYWIRCRDLGLSTRLRNALQNDYRLYVFDAVRLTIAEFNESPNVGKVSLKELQHVLSDLGLSLGVVVADVPDDYESIARQAHERFQSDGSITALIGTRSSKAASANQEEEPKAVAILRNVNVSAQQLRALQASPELSGELLDLFERAKALTDKLGVLPLGRMLTRPDEVVSALSDLKKDRTPE